MSHTVIGIFKNSNDARQAAERLQAKGISGSAVDFRRSQYLDGTADRDGRNTNEITDFFNKLFGHDNDNARRYSTIGQEDVFITTVHATSEEQAEMAADVLDDCGAVKVDEEGGEKMSRRSFILNRPVGDSDRLRSDNPFHS